MTDADAASAPKNTKIRETRFVTRRNPNLAVFIDFFRCLAMWRIWMSLSWQEFRSTYRRSLIGVAWVMISFAGFLFVKLVIFSSLLKTPDAKYYNAYLMIGLYAWLYISQSVNAAPDTFVSAQGWIKSEPLPFSLYVAKSVMREVYNLLFTAIPLAVALAYVGYPIREHAWYALLALGFLILNAASLKLLLGIIGARLRDVSHMVKAVMMPTLFLTPVFWMPSQMQPLMKYLWWNPFYHFINIFRAPIIDDTLPTQSWIFVSVVYGVVTFLGFVMFVRYRGRIVFWL